MFGGPLHAYFGVQPNNPANIGLGATLGRVQISGTGTPIDDTFTASTVNSENWEVVAADPAGVIPVPAEALYWLTWTVPDVGYRLQTAFGLPGAWSNLALPAPQLGSRKRILVYSSSLPVTETGNYFFRLAK
jgi:hypothetical protein